MIPKRTRQDELQAPTLLQWWHWKDRRLPAG